MPVSFTSFATSSWIATPKLLPSSTFGTCSVMKRSIFLKSSTQAAASPRAYVWSSQSSAFVSGVVAPFLYLISASASDVAWSAPTRPSRAMTLSPSDASRASTSRLRWEIHSFCGCAAIDCGVDGVRETRSATTPPIATPRVDGVESHSAEGAASCDLCTNAYADASLS